MPITTEVYGAMPGGGEVNRYTLTNSQGMVLTAIDYGGIITELHVPDREGELRDVVLGLNSLEEYLRGHPFFGAIAGRVAGRITGAAFTLDGVEYRLACNNPPNHLHGGIDGFDKKRWASEASESAEGTPSLTLRYTSPDGEEGYPGSVSIEIVYSLTPDNALRIDYEATTDRATPLSMTNHSYFNLAGDGSGDIGEHLLTIHTDLYVPTDEDLTLCGRVESLSGTAVDFSSEKAIGEIIGEPLQTHGDNYMVRHDDAGDLAPVATVRNPASGIVMDVLSTESCVQFYTGKFLGDDPIKGKSGRVYAAYDGFCLECHGYPDGVNVPEVDDIILRPEETYQQTTIYRFSTV